MTWQPGAFIASPQDAEEFAAFHMRGLGYGDATRTPTGPDGGVDVYSSRALSQVKQIAVQVGRPDIQRLVGARGRDTHLDLLFYSATGYSRSAVAYADDMDVALFTYDLAGVVTPVNTSANGMTQFASASRAADERAVVDQAARKAKVRRRWLWVLGVWLAVFSVPYAVVWAAAGFAGRDDAVGNVVISLAIPVVLWFLGRRDVRKHEGAHAHPFVRRLFRLS